MAQGLLEVQHGLWIDEELIRTAGLEGRLQVVVTPGEIRIVPEPQVTTEANSISSAGWEILRSLGEDAPAGKFDDTSANHDRYLYGQHE